MLNRKIKIYYSTSYKFKQNKKPKKKCKNKEKNKNNLKSSICFSGKNITYPEKKRHKN